MKDKMWYTYHEWYLQDWVSSLYLYSSILKVFVYFFGEVGNKCYETVY